MLGVVVGLCGATAFCLRGNVMHNIPLALGATMWQFVEAGLFEYSHLWTNLIFCFLLKNSFAVRPIKLPASG